MLQLLKTKRFLQIFREVSGVFQQNFNGSKNSAVLEPRTGQFSRTKGFEAKAKDLRLRGQGLQNVSSRPRTSSRTPPLLNNDSLIVARHTATLHSSFQYKIINYSMRKALLCANIVRPIMKKIEIFIMLNHVHVCDGSAGAEFTFAALRSGITASFEENVAAVASRYQHCL